MLFTLSIESDGEGGYTAALSDQDGDSPIIEGIYGDTGAEAAMTAIYNALQEVGDDHKNGWRHTQ